MPYVNRYDGRNVETVDHADSRKEARRLVREYRLADTSAEYRVSSRATREWREELAAAERAEADRQALARGFRYVAELRPYSHAPGRVGELSGPPVILSRHKSAKAAGRALGSAISGKAAKAAARAIWEANKGEGMGAHYDVRDVRTGYRFSRSRAAQM